MPENSSSSRDLSFMFKHSGFKCGECLKFKTKECPMGENFVDSETQACEQFLPKKTEALIQFFSNKLIENFELKHFVKNGSSLGLHIWENGVYVEREEYLRSYIEELANDLGIQSKIKSHIVKEAIEKTKRRTYFELKEEPLRIAFNNVILDWKAFLEGNRERMFLPLEVTKEEPCFHRIPHNLNIEFFDKVVGETNFEKAVEDNAKEILEVFKSWVGDNWKLLFEIIGYALYPKYDFNKAFMLVGEGSNGKSSYLKLLEKILGKENVANLSLQELCLDRFAPANLYHKLANIFADIPENPIPNVGKFKMLTGQDSIEADRKFRDRIKFESYAKLIFSANVLPDINDKTEAFWRRWTIVEFPNKFEDNPEFFEKTFTEEVIEKIIVLGLIAFVRVWIDRKFSIEGEASDFKEQWLRSSNSIYAYIKNGIEEGRLILKEEEKTLANELYDDYLDFCSDNDLKPESKKTFTMELERLFKITKERARVSGNRAYFYMNVKLVRRYREAPEEAQ